MRLTEKNPLPQRCVECQEAKEAEAAGYGIDACCYNCDYALERWIMANDEVEEV